MSTHASSQAVERAALLHLRGLLPPAAHAALLRATLRRMLDHERDADGEARADRPVLLIVLRHAQAAAGFAALDGSRFRLADGRNCLLRLVTSQFDVDSACGRPIEARHRWPDLDAREALPMPGQGWKRLQGPPGFLPLDWKQVAGAAGDRRAPPPAGPRRPG